MNNFLTSFKSLIYLSFFLGIIILFFKYLFLPILIFIIILKIISKFKINRVIKSKVNKNKKYTGKKNRIDIIDAEFEDVE
jgi:uncharacterized membrane protein